MLSNPLGLSCSDLPKSDDNGRLGSRWARLSLSKAAVLNSKIRCAGWQEFHEEKIQKPTSKIKQPSVGRERMQLPPDICSLSWSPTVESKAMLNLGIGCRCNPASAAFPALCPWAECRSWLPTAAVTELSSGLKVHRWLRFRSGVLGHKQSGFLLSSS